MVSFYTRTHTHTQNPKTRTHVAPRKHLLLCVSYLRHPLNAQSMLNPSGRNEEIFPLSPCIEYVTAWRYRFVCMCICAWILWYKLCVVFVCVCVLLRWWFFHSLSTNSQKELALQAFLFLCILVFKSWGLPRHTMIYVGFTEYLWTENGAHHPLTPPPLNSPPSLYTCGRLFRRANIMSCKNFPKLELLCLRRPPHRISILRLLLCRDVRRREERPAAGVYSASVSASAVGCFDITFWRIGQSRTRQAGIPLLI